MDESPSNPLPVDSWEEEADKETEEGKKPLALPFKCSLLWLLFGDGFAFLFY